MKPFLLLVLLLLVASSSLAAEAGKPKVYNHPTPEGAAIDPLVSAAFASKFTVVDITDDSTYVRPKVKAGSLPRVAKTEDGKSIGGEVLLGFIISIEGRVIEPVVLKASDPRLGPFAIKAVEGWRMEPASLHGAAISTTGAQEFTFETAPTEFVTQVLEPTGGKIARPKEWHYREQHKGPKYDWIISREDLEKNKRYDTGVRIQCFSGIKEGTGKTAKQFVLDFLDDKKKNADTVVNSTTPAKQDLFTRVCLETEEGPFHILYSLFWLNGSEDMAVVSIAGTPRELWDTYQETFNKMSTFELIDMDRFKE